MRLGLLHACHPYLDKQIEQIPPLGLGYLSAVAKQTLPGVEVCVEKDLESLLEHRPDILGISYTTFNAEYAAELARSARDSMDIPLIAGGVHVSALPQSLDPAFNVAVLREGEVTFAELLRLFDATGRLDSRDLQKVAGVAFYDENGRFCQTEPRPFLANLDAVPHPDREVLRGKWELGRYRASVISSRGCPYRCTFCSTTRHWGQKLRYPSDAYVLEEIAEIRENDNPHTIIFQDDLFTTNKPRVLRLLAALRERGLHQGVSLQCSVRADRMDEEIMESLVESGMRILSVGIESASDRILHCLNKKTLSREKNNALLEMGRQAGVAFSASYIFGVPGETREDIVASINQIADHADVLDYVQASQLMILPGTEYWRMSREKYGLDETDMRGLMIRDSELETPDTYFFKHWLYLNEENMPRAELKAYLDITNRLTSIINTHAYEKKMADPDHYFFAGPPPLDTIARTVALKDIIKAKIRRRLG